MNFRAEVEFVGAPSMGWQGDAECVGSVEHQAVAEARRLGWRERVKRVLIADQDGRLMTVAQAKKTWSVAA